MKICVGSKNPVKINATKIAFESFFNNVEIYSWLADSKVGDQPIGLNKILEGALNRSREALNSIRTKFPNEKELYGVGIEAGLVEISKANTGYMDFQFCIIIDKNEMTTIGSGVAFEYPSSVINQLFSEDKEIGEIMGRIANNMNLKKESGAIGYLTNTTINRIDILTQAVICALVPRLNKELYSKNTLD
ncbi:MAG: inosine/xanthosine triphosphatase [Candidatus Lokiarchaeota archaeon]|nr:inosine/xanthosine triphosphatase [Candidatus Lokiarchaeota archaeon]MBD3202630.1 inosine/xanthosine triphosphatase [Candidatus Lokiarchaeota archaeon]